MQQPTAHIRRTSLSDSIHSDGWTASLSTPNLCEEPRIITPRGATLFPSSSARRAMIPGRQTCTSSNSLSSPPTPHSILPRPPQIPHCRACPFPRPPSRIFCPHAQSTPRQQSAASFAAAQSRSGAQEPRIGCARVPRATRTLPALTCTRPPRRLQIHPSKPTPHSGWADRGVAGAGGRFGCTRRGDAVCGGARGAAKGGTR